mgnify:CR=1 FL=1
MTDPSPEQLNSFARTFGKLYNDLLIGTKTCQVENCKRRRDDGSCGCIDMVRDIVDAIWEAKAGNADRLVEAIDKAHARLDALDKSEE